MEKKKNVSPSVDEAKLRIELYNKLCDAVRDLTHDEACIVLCTVEYYLNLLVVVLKGHLIVCLVKFMLMMFYKII